MSISVISKTFLSSIETDLRNLAAEAKKADPHVKEIAEKAIHRLKEIELSHSSDGSDSEYYVTAVAAEHEVVDAFCKACEITGNSKVGLQSVGGLNKLLTHQAIAKEKLMDLLTALETQALNSNDNSVILKVLQALLSLLTARHYRVALGDNGIVKAIMLLLGLESKVSSSSGSSAAANITYMGIIEQTREAAFRQVAADFFQNAFDSFNNGTQEEEEDSKPSNVPDSIPQTAHGAYFLFSDLCSILGGDECTWFKKCDLRLSLVLDVLIDCLNTDIFGSDAPKEMKALLTKCLCPAIHKALRSCEDSSNFGKLAALSITLIKGHFSDLLADCEVLLTLLARIADDSTNIQTGSPELWRNYFALEAIRILLLTDDYRLANSFVRNYDMQSSSSNVFGEITKSAVVVLKVITCDASLIPSTPMREASISLSTFQTPSTNLARITSSAIGVCVAAIRSLFPQIRKESYEAENDGGDLKSTLEQTLELTWKALFSNLSPVLTLLDTESNTFIVTLDIFELLFKACNFCELYDARDKILRALLDAVSRQFPLLSEKSDTKKTVSYKILALYHKAIKCCSFARAVLGDSWPIIIDALEVLDAAVYCKIARTSLSMSKNNDNGKYEYLRSMKNELEDFFLTLDALDGNSKLLLMKALISSSQVKVTEISNEPSTSTAPAVQKNSAQIRIFGISRSEQIMVASFAIGTAQALSNGLWELLMRHLISVSTKNLDIEVRHYALQTISRLVTIALGAENPAVSQDKALEPLSDLLSSSFFDTRSGLLTTLHTVLQSQGQRLREDKPWERIIAILRKVHEKEVAFIEFESSLVQLGFKSVHLIDSDYLSNLTQGVLPSWIELISAYASQSGDVNVALTAVGMFWSVADFLARGRRILETKSQEIDEKHTFDDNAAMDVFWSKLLIELKTLGTDSRPEIRNGTVKTLSGCMSAHGSRLSITAWISCFEDCFLPLVHSVMKGERLENSSSSSKAKDGDGEETLLLHHSRDTPVKQWNETKVLTITGIGRTFKLHIRKFYVLPSIVDYLNELLKCSGKLACDESREVALAGVNSLLDLMQGVVSLSNIQSFQSEERTTPEPERVQSKLMESIWNFVDKLTANDSKSDRMTYSKAICVFLSGLGNVRSSLSEKYSSAESERFMNVLIRFAKSSEPVDESTTSITDVQEAALSTLESLDFGTDEETWAILLKNFLNLGCRSTPESVENGDCNGYVSTPVRSKAMCSIMNILSGTRIPLQVKCSMLTYILESVRDVMSQRPSKELDVVPTPQPLWAVAVLVFEIGVKESFNPTEGYPKEFWNLYFEMIEEFLYSNTLMSLSSHGGSMEDQSTQLTSRFILRDLSSARYLRCHYDLLILSSLEIIARRCINSPEETKVYLIRSIERGAKEGHYRCQVARMCQKILFELSNERYLLEDPYCKDRQNLSKLALESLFAVATKIFSDYYEDSIVAGDCPLPALRRAEIIYMLKGLLKTKLATSKDSSSVIQKLYPNLCKCTISKDKAVKALASKILMMMGS